MECVSDFEVVYLGSIPVDLTKAASGTKEPRAASRVPTGDTGEGGEASR
jgi:hypothetical protein